MAAYINVTLSLIPYLSASSRKLPPVGPEPPNNSNRSLSFVPGVVYDKPPFFKNFGDVLADVQEIYRHGTPAVAVFVGANPRNDLKLGQSYAVVEKLGEERKTWQIVRDDGDWHLVFRWRRTSELLGTSEVEITWETEDWAEPGVYRIKYFGSAKSMGGTVTDFEGVSSVFKLL